MPLSLTKAPLKVTPPCQPAGRSSNNVSTVGARGIRAARKQACGYNPGTERRSSSPRKNSSKLLESSLLPTPLRRVSEVASVGDRQRKSVVEDADSSRLSEELWPPTSRLFPSFDNTTSRNVTSQLGQTAYLHCIVNNLGDKTYRKYFQCLLRTYTPVSQGGGDS
ncbi:hypothetical protein HPB47_023999 [Ixodes persulcatus]|uniref:Uncharacterized protein n=1 Tax=Ixodes persulcatus TaxID=34615 RepID=A0AC60Q8H6_IXOPE|nr:hypothetical protein HPB47_023999 [Ixodes persulcatus]